MTCTVAPTRGHLREETDPDWPDHWAVAYMPGSLPMGGAAPMTPIHAFRSSEKLVRRNLYYPKGLIVLRNIYYGTI